MQTQIIFNLVTAPPPVPTGRHYSPSLSHQNHLELETDSNDVRLINTGKRDIPATSLVLPASLRAKVAFKKAYHSCGNTNVRE